MANDKPEYADMVISVKSEHMNKIVSRRKTYEFREYLILKPTRRYIAVIGGGKHPVEIDEVDKGIGNEEFNTNQMEAKYAHEILHLYGLREPLSFYELKELEFLRAPPPSAK